MWDYFLKLPILTRSTLLPRVLVEHSASDEVLGVGGALFGDSAVVAADQVCAGFKEVEGLARSYLD